VTGNAEQVNTEFGNVERQLPGGLDGIAVKQDPPLTRQPGQFRHGLQATDDGLWIADQDEGRAFLVAPDDGEVLRSFRTGAGKSSGVAFGHGALWMCSNGLPVTRPATAVDTAHTRIVKTDPHTGAMLAQFRVPGDSDVHGLEWTAEGLWLTTLDQRALTLVDADTR